MGARHLQPIDAKCPNCGERCLVKFYECTSVPAHSVLLFETKQEAIDFPTGDVSLAFCSACQFITNTAFDQALEQYGAGYEATQSFSPTFNAFHRQLAADLIDRYDLHGKSIIEIGCGQGEFLHLLCEMGDNHGIGFDPAYLPERASDLSSDRYQVIADYYSEKYADRSGDFVCCKQTLEHIPDTANFVQIVRRAIGDDVNTTVFFQVPDITRILHEIAFWDIYYEHCSYFSGPSLHHLFDRNGFDVVASRLEYGEQYLMIECKPTNGVRITKAPAPTQAVADDVRFFADHYEKRLAYWRSMLHELAEAGRRAVLWGGGSKAVAFLTSLKIGAEIDYAVDINPHKHGTFLAGSGHRVLGPDALKEYPPDLVIVMNPIYLEEVASAIRELGVQTDLKPVTAFS